MVLLKMLMEIDPLTMRGSLVMTMVMISPSRREVSPEEQLCRSSRLVPPRFRLVAAEFHPVSLPTIFPGKNPSYSRRWQLEAHQGAQEIGGAPYRGGPVSWTGCGPPGLFLLRSVFFIYSGNNFRESFRTIAAV